MRDNPDSMKLVYFSTIIVSKKIEAIIWKYLYISQVFVSCFEEEEKYLSPSKQVPASTLVPASTPVPAFTAPVPACLFQIDFHPDIRESDSPGAKKFAVNKRGI